MTVTAATTDHQRLVEVLADLDLFATCDPPSLEAVAGCITATTTVGEGEPLCTEGEPASSWWAVVAGTADVTVGGRFVGTIGAGEAVGELAVLLGGARTATVTATSELTALEIAGDRFDELADWTAGVAGSLVRCLAARLRATNDILRGPAQGSSARPVESTPAAATAISGPSAEPVVWNPLEPGYFDDPYPMLDAIREQQAVQWVPMTDSFLITRYEDVKAIPRDPDHSVNVRLASPSPTRDAQVAQLDAQGNRGEHSILRLDAPDHTRLRRLVSRAFTPRAVQAWRERTIEITDHLLDEMAERGTFDVVADYATIVPCQVISEMLGLPLGDVPRIRAWSNAMVKTLDPINSDEDRAAAVEASAAMYDYLAGLIADKKSNRGDDILSTLLEVADDGDRLSDAELVDQLALLYIAGHETTINLIANGTRLLLEHDDQRLRLLGDPSLDANTVEEVLRFDPVVLMNRRITTRDIVVGETDIPAGSALTLSIAAANRDPRHWGPTAGQFDIGRPGAHEHTTFGGGAHYCLGQALARMEGQVALPGLIRRFPNLRLAGDPVAYPRIVFRALAALPVATA